MANLDKLFKKFCDEITISKTKKESLRTSRDSLREDIRDWFSSNDKNGVLFSGQGSYAMKTLIGPINGKDYDIDDGVYLKGFEEKDISDWPVPSTVHMWIKSAVEDKTKNGVTDKDTCVRVKYSNGYHVDIPAYIIADNKAYLAHKSKGWFVSDPKSFKKWFIDKVNDEDNYGEQLRRVVKYLKAWRDYCDSSLKGIEITILASNNFELYEGRDDKALKNTVDNIVSTLKVNFVCKKPVEPYEDLFEDASVTRKNNIISELKILSKNLELAINDDDEKEATTILRDKVFGDRYPLGKEAKKGCYTMSPAPGLLKSDGRSA